MPVAPERFSTITGLGSERRSCSARSLVATSVLPPAPNPTSIVMARLGHSCALAVSPIASSDMVPPRKERLGIANWFMSTFPAHPGLQCDECCSVEHPLEKSLHSWERDQRSSLRIGDQTEASLGMVHEPENVECASISDTSGPPEGSPAA